MQAGRVVPVPAPTQSSISKAAAKRQSKAADRKRRQTEHVKGTRTLDRWLKGTRSADTEMAIHAAPSTLSLPQDTHHKRPRLSAAITSTKAPRGEGRLKSGKKGASDQAASVQPSDLDLARIRAVEYERLRPEGERQEAQRQQDLEAHDPGDTGNSEWAYRRDTQRFMVAWVGDRPRWPRWLPEAAGLYQGAEGRRNSTVRAKRSGYFVGSEERSEAKRSRKGEEACATGGLSGTGGIGSKAPHH